MNRKHTNKFRKISCGIGLGVIVLCLVASGISFLSNLTLPQGPETLDRLDPLDKIRLEETLHLRETLGEVVWLGLGQASIPISLHNRDYSFLIGYPGKPPADWEIVPGDAFLGQPYYRKVEQEAQNFAIKIGETWAAGMATKSEMDRFIIELYQGFLPPVIEQVFPYRLLLQSTEVQIGGVLHESFHVLQAQKAPERLEAAEKAHRLGERYWSADSKTLDLWKEEVRLLAKAFEAKTDEEASRLASQFLEHRQARREEVNLPLDLIEYERQLEWEEGMAKYVELEFLRQAYQVQDYQPIEAMREDASFKNYQTFKQRWSQEIIQMKMDINQTGEVSFYMTGMAQTYLLDRLSPGWKAKALAEGVFLENLLREALTE